jgi:3-deoxy-manno-octulosonate cytidylyltransferase (CMP-KDO synthetase)
MKIVAVIPARYESSRFPGKPLALIAGRAMVLRVVDQVTRCSEIERTIVATDDERIALACRAAGVETEMTGAHHRSGTDRLVEVCRQIDADVYVNVQGDEPLISPSSITTVIDRYRQARSQGIDVATVYLEGTTPEQDASTSVVHLVPTLDGRVISLSRLPVPFAMQASYTRNIHVGLYAYSRPALERFASREPGPVERAESIELMRFLEYGDAIACAPVTELSIGVDLPEDIARVEALLTVRGEA